MILSFFIILLSSFFASANLQGMRLDKIFRDQYPCLTKYGDVIPNDQLPVLAYVYIREITNYTDDILFTKHLNSRKEPIFAPLPSRHCSMINIRLAQITLKKVHKTNLVILDHHQTHIFCKGDTPTTICVFKGTDSTFKKYLLAPSVESVVREALFNESLRPYQRIALAINLSIGPEGNVTFTNARIGVDEGR